MSFSVCTLFSGSHLVMCKSCYIVFWLHNSLLIVPLFYMNVDFAFCYCIIIYGFLGKIADLVYKQGFPYQ